MYAEMEKDTSVDISNNSNDSGLPSQGSGEKENSTQGQETSGTNIAEIEKLIDTKIGLLYDKLITNATSSQEPKEPNTEIEKEPDNYEW